MYIFNKQSFLVAPMVSVVSVMTYSAVVLRPSQLRVPPPTDTHTHTHTHTPHFLSTLLSYPNKSQKLLTLFSDIWPFYYITINTDHKLTLTAWIKCYLFIRLITISGTDCSAGCNDTCQVVGAVQIHFHAATESSHIRLVFGF